MVRVVIRLSFTVTLIVIHVHCLTGKEVPTMYEQISQAEFEEFLDGFAQFEEVEMEETDEVVYVINLPADDLELRIFSSLQDGHARRRGSDAIRTVIWSTEHSIPVTGREKTLRIETWRSNLEPKIRDLMGNWREHVPGKCSECGTGVLQHRDGSFGEFLGCSNYPQCDYTEDVDK